MSRKRQQVPGSKSDTLQPGNKSVVRNVYFFNDYRPATGLNYYRLKIIDTENDFMYSDTITVKLNANIVYQNVPNPFSTSTTIRYAVTAKALVKITVYNNLGIPVAVLANEIKQPGFYEVQWNAGNIASGSYFYIVSIGDDIRTVKMLKLN